MPSPLLTLILALTFAVPAHAQTKRKPAAEPVRTATLGGTGSSQDKLMSRDELRACLQRQQALDPRRAELARFQTELDRERGELVQSGQALQADLAALDRSSAEAVNAYNARAAARDAKVDAWNQRNARLNDEARTQQADQQSWQADCAGRRYREDDEIALRKAR